MNHYTGQKNIKGDNYLCNGSYPFWFHSQFLLHLFNN